MYKLSELKKQAKKEGVAELQIDTTYTGYDDITYKARATLTIEEDGTYYVSAYDFFDTEINDWENTEERGNWTDQEIREEFNIELDK